MLSSSHVTELTVPIQYRRIVVLVILAYKPIQERGPEGLLGLAQLLFWRMLGRNPRENQRSFFGLVFFSHSPPPFFFHCFPRFPRIAFASRRRVRVRGDGGHGDLS